ncbi:hypothetical protein AOLI_G00240680 [Acnodon oligacanthus]
MTGCHGPPSPLVFSEVWSLMRLTAELDWKGQWPGAHGCGLGEAKGPGDQRKEEEMMDEEKKLEKTWILERSCVPTLDG